MGDEEIFALHWLETDDVYQALDPIYIEEKMSQKLSLQSDKSKGVVEEEAEQVEVDESRF